MNQLKITPRLPNSLREFDQNLQKNLASRKGELKSLKGFRWLLRRLKIELWAWRKTLRESETDSHSIE